MNQSMSIILISFHFWHLFAIISNLRLVLRLEYDYDILHEMFPKVSPLNQSFSQVIFSTFFEYKQK